MITPTHGGSPFIRETYRSLVDQSMPDGWSWEWLLQEDGSEPSLDGSTFADPRVRYEANGTRLGVAMTRNMALSRARGQFVQVLDHDDLLLADALNRHIDALSDARIGWAIGQADDLLPDGTRESFAPLIPLGLVSKGAVIDYAVANGGNFPLHCANLFARTPLIRALGGWAASPADEDLVLAAALSELASGWHGADVTWLYRQHASQITRDPRTTKWSELSRRIALQRADAVRQTGLVFGNSSTDAEGGLRIEIGPAEKRPS
ncbi:Glycosyl transferase [Stackebrandtia soli]